MTTGQTTNETGIPYTWVHKGILKHFPMHSEGTRARERERERERKKEWVSVVCARKICVVLKDGQMEMSKATAVEP